MRVISLFYRSGRCPAMGRWLRTSGGSASDRQAIFRWFLTSQPLSPIYVNVIYIHALSW